MRFLNDSTLARCNPVGAKAKVEIVTLHNFDFGRVEQKWKKWLEMRDDGVTIIGAGN